MAEKSFSLKDDLFNIESVTYLCTKLKETYPSFESEAYIKEALINFPYLELKERMTLMTSLLYKYLPTDFLKATDILSQSLELVNADSMFVFGSYCEYVTTYGCHDDLVDYSLGLLSEYTKWFSSEFAIRDFITLYPDKSFATMEACSLSDNFHQRRFASEGLRPKLPWAKGIKFDYKKAGSLLNNLYFDKERYVTRSVANHLNDLSKIDPDFVLELLGNWRKEGKQEINELNYMINHALRTLIKKGHPAALEFLGYHQNPKVRVKNLVIINPVLILGDSLSFNFEIEATADEQLIVDYQITYPMANKKRSTKVFKLKKSLFKKSSTTTITKNHPFRAMTTKKLYSGIYEIHIQVNGQLYEQGSFELTV